MRVKRGFSVRLGAMLAFGLSAVVVFAGAPASPAHAAVLVSPDAPRPINVLPSVARAGLSTGISAPASQQALMHFLTQAGKSPDFWRAAAAVKAGGATTAQVATVTAVQAGFRLPAIAPGGLVRVVGGVGVAVAGLEVGMMAGAGVLDLVGFDTENVVCANTGGDPIGTIARWASRTDCDGFARLPASIPNFGIVAGVSSAWACSTTNSVCWRVTGMATRQLTPTTSTPVTCIEVTPNTTTNSQFIFERASGVVQIALEGTMPLRWERGFGICGPAYHWSWSGGWANPVVPIDPIVKIQHTSRGDTIGAAATPVVTASADPLRFMRCEITGTNGTVYASNGVTYTDGSSTGVKPPECPQLPTGVGVGTVRILEDTAGARSLVYEQATTPEYNGHATTYPECMSGTCMLDLRKLVNAAPVSCFQSPALCKDWFSDPNRASVYSCTYGSQAVDLAECNVYAPSFQSDASAGTGYGSPATGETVPGSGTTAPNVGAGGFPSSVGDPASERECFPTGWSVFNPVEWVQKPIGCALEWAFVPRPSVVEGTLTDLRTQWAISPPGLIAAQVGSLVPEQAPDGCEGLPFDLSWVGATASSQGFDFSTADTVYLLEACPGDVLHPWSVGVNLILSGGILLLGVKTSLALVGRMANYSGIDAA